MKRFLSLLLPLLASPTYADNSEQSIEKITVNATRQEQSRLEVSSNISLVNQQALQLIEHQHINQSLVRVPGGWISRGNGQEHLTAIRSPVLTGAGGCGAFYIAQDGISARAAGFCNANQLFDLNTLQAASIEVLNGPASTLYGSNAVHGVINVVSPDVFAETSNNISVNLGPHGYQRALFRLSSASDQQGLLFYGNVTQDDGYLDDSGYNQQKLNLIHQYQQGKWQIKNVLAASRLDQQTAGFISGFEVYKDAQLKTQNPNPEAYRNSRSARLYSQINYLSSATSKLTLKPYVRTTEMQFLQHYLPWQPVEENQQTGAGLQIQFEQEVVDFSWLAGMDVDVTQGQLVEFQAEDFAPTLPQGLHYDYKVDAQVYSPFAKLTWFTTPRLSLSAGLRFDKTQYDYQNRLSAGSVCSAEVQNCRFTRPADQIVSFSQWSYQFNALYALANNDRLYGQFSSGYRAPQATELFRLQGGQTVAELQAEQMRSIEIGVRGQHATLSYDLSVFSMQKDNFIFQDTNRFNINDGETSHRGLEVALKYQWQAVYLSANGTLAKHKYDSSIQLSQSNIQGNEIDTAPEHLASMQLGWQHTLGGTVELEWVHVGNYYVNPENTAEYSGHKLINLRANWPLTEQLTMAVRISNLTDQDYAERADFGFGNYRYFVGEPRSVYVTAQLDF